MGLKIAQTILRSFHHDDNYSGLGGKWEHSYCTHIDPDSDVDTSSTSYPDSEMRTEPSESNITNNDTTNNSETESRKICEDCEHRRKVARYTTNPILLVCYTNHALDQFMEGVLEFCSAKGMFAAGISLLISLVLKSEKPNIFTTID